MIKGPWPSSPHLLQMHPGEGIQNITAQCPWHIYSKRHQSAKVFILRDARPSAYELGKQLELRAACPRASSGVESCLDLPMLLHNLPKHRHPSGVGVMAPNSGFTFLIPAHCQGCSPSHMFRDPSGSTLLCNA